MVIITRWRFMGLGNGCNITNVMDEVVKLVDWSQKCEKRITGHQCDEYYYNEVGPEFVSIQKIDRYGVLEELEGDSQNNEMGLKLMKLGFAIHSVEHLRDISSLKEISKACAALS